MNKSELDFQKIYGTFQPKIHRYLTRLVGENEAEDLTQEVFVKVRQGLRNFRGKSQLSTWIYRIATNAGLDRLRSSSFQRMVQESLSNDSVIEGEIGIEDKDVWTGEKTPSVEQELIRKEMNECIRNFIEKLPENYRTILVLSELEGLKNHEIAKILRVSLDTVKIRLHRARAKLKEELQTHCSFYHDERNELACDLKITFKEFRKAY
jgi:RNA polymerase sigma-70 factor, ECF subfamily